MTRRHIHEYEVRRIRCTHIFPHGNCANDLHLALELCAVTSMIIISLTRDNPHTF